MRTLTRQMVMAVGFPACGKGVVTSMVAEGLEVPPDCVYIQGVKLREVRESDPAFAKKYGPVMDNRGLLPPEIPIRIFREWFTPRLASAKPKFVLDGFVRQQEQAGELVRLIHDGFLLNIIHIDKPWEVCRVNAIGRGRPDDKALLDKQKALAVERTIQDRMRRYEMPSTMMLLRRHPCVRLLTIRTSGILEYFQDDILRWIRAGKGASTQTLVSR